MSQPSLVSSHEDILSVKMFPLSSSTPGLGPEVRDEEGLTKKVEVEVVPMFD